MRDTFNRIVKGSQRRSYTLLTPVVGRSLDIDGRPWEFFAWWRDHLDAQHRPKRFGDLDRHDANAETCRDHAKRGIEARP
jgi:hypothetical protein